MIRSLNKKLLRDLWRIRGQALAIALVIAGGVAALVMSMSTLHSLQDTQQAYYERYRFAEIFAHARRAPQSLAAEISAIPGVGIAETRIVRDVVIDVAGMDEPSRGRVISRVPGVPGLLNELVIRQGRALRPGHPDEVLIHEAFAEAHGMVPGDVIGANINERRRQLKIVGIALSPEYIYAIGPGDIVPDNRHFGVFWMDRETLEAAYDLKGAFDSVTLSLSRGAQESEIIARLDRLLDPYGGTGAISREDQISDAFLRSEMEQLANLSRITPPIFLAVAAFLLNVVIARLIQTEREQIGLLKAFGYGNGEVGWHYFKFVMAITFLGVLLGWSAGAWMGRALTELYGEFFSFPFLYYRLDPSVFGTAALVSIAAAGIGTFNAVRQVVRLAPAVAMVPPPPTAYRANLIERLGMVQTISQPARMILRHIFRWPMRAALTVTGMASAVAILVSSLFFVDAMDEMMEIYFFDTERQDMRMVFTEIRPQSVHTHLDDLPGVLTAETFRIVPARLRFGHREERIAVRGLEPGAHLSRLVDAKRQPVEIPAEGLVLSKMLAEMLGAQHGDLVTFAALEGRRPTTEVPVTRIVEQYIGIAAYMDRHALNRLMREGDVVSGADILTDRTAYPALFRKLKSTPALLGLTVQATAYATFRGMIDEHLLTMISFYVIFAGFIAVGVVYNSARISLAERGRELASMRVLGFTRGEVGFILVGELAALTLLALPLGCVLGYGLAAFMVSMFDTELYRVPLVIHPATYGFSVVTVLIAAAGSAALVVRRIATLDLIAVLKTRE